MPVQKKITGTYNVRKTTTRSASKVSTAITSPSKRSRQDENHRSSKELEEEASSRPKQTRNVVDSTVPSIVIDRIPLSPRKDFNLSSPVRQTRSQCSSPNTLPKTCSQAAERHLTRTRRNLTRSFVDLTADSSSCLWQKCSSVEELENEAAISHLREPEAKPKSSSLLRTPSKSSKKSNTPSKAAAKLKMSPSKSIESASKHELANLRLVKDNGECYQKIKAVLHSALPSDALVGRASESRAINDFIVSHLSRMVPGSMYVSGAPGTGKTAVIMKTIEQLQAAMADTCKVVSINCMSVRNSYDIHRTILSHLLDKPVSVSTKQAAVDVEQYITASNSMILLVVDEMDSLDCKSQQVLYTLFEWPSLPKSKLILIGIANSLDLTDRVLPRLHVKSHCRPQLLHFAPYTRTEITAILDNRLAQVEGSEAVLDSSAVQMCARKVAAVAGDTRTALDICRRAVESVESETRRQLRLGCDSPSERSATPSVRRVGLKDVLKVINDVTSNTSRLVSSSASGPHSTSGGVVLPLQQTVAVCTLLLMTDENRTSKRLTNCELTLGKFHECFCRVCHVHGVTSVSQSDFLTVCQNLEAQGIFSLKTSKDTRSAKVGLKMLRDELEMILNDKTLMSAILHKGVPS